MKAHPCGTIIGINGQVVEIEFGAHPPSLFDILTSERDRSIQIEVYASASDTSYFGIALSRPTVLCRGMILVNTGQPLTVPSGKAILGRAMDIFGQPQDGGKAIVSDHHVQLHHLERPPIGTVRPPETILETGIKAVDFFAPVLKGGKIGLFGGAGVGKTTLLTELINNLLIRNTDPGNSLAVYSAVGERSREAHELYHILRQTAAFEYTTLLLGQMGESPAVRSRTAYASAAVAQHFRDHFGKDILFLMDNVYRFAQAGHELSILMNSIPSEDGYQPTLTSEMGQLHEQLLSTKKGHITTIEAIFVPSDDMTDYGVRSVFPYLDTVVIMSRSVYQEGRVPAMDLLESTSTGLTKDFITTEHYETYLEAKHLLELAKHLEKIVSLVGFSELTLEDQKVYKRSILLRNYMTQSFYATTTQTGQEGAYVPLQTTVRDVRTILSGKLDELEPDRIRLIGKLPQT